MLDPNALHEITARLSDVDARRASHYPGERTERQPVHTCYVPAGAVGPDLVRDWGSRAAEALRTLDPPALAEVAGLSGPIAEDVYPRVAHKLATEPVEDLRIDFEDGYGAPGDETEDADAVRAAGCVAGWLAEGGIPPYLGLRIKSFDTVALRERGIRTLDVFLSALLGETGGALPPGFAITLPKVTAREQVEVFADVLALLEKGLGLPEIPFEVQVETTQSIVDMEGRIALPGFLTAGRGRVRGLHFGTYDYTAGLGLPAAGQHLAHRACDFARHVMQVSAAGTGVWCSDGSTNVLPVGAAESVRHGWRTHAELVRRGLDHGFYQGWDLHPHQLVTRYATVFGFYRAGLPAALSRLDAYLTASGGAIADEPATAAPLATFVLRALRCAATTPAEIQSALNTPLKTLTALTRRT